jgi:hypothetical protein
MLSRKSFHGAGLIPSIARFSPKFPSVTRFLRFFHIACAVILMCAAATRDVRAQDPCADPVLNPPLPCLPTFQANPDGTKAALACQWINAGTIDNVLGTLKLLTDPTRPADLNQQLLKQLGENPPNPRDPGLYLAALQNPQIDFLDLLAKANTITPLEKKKPWSKQKDDKDKLFKCTQSMINNIFEAPPPEDVQHSGPIVLAGISSSFAKGNRNLALRQLLDAYPKPNENASDAEKQSYAGNLEKFRAAFEMDADKLAGQVANPK